ncbi:MAG TPA: RNA degradosome polyphosphate kinase [Acidimicrobiales bacterium]|nr:RNA degradosome polyphosphate kinase [Acidimicrobiales bacterium]
MSTSLEPAAPAGGGADLQAASARFINRELSWLDFNERVLALAEDARQPLLERAKFLAIYSTNLDEFFQVRVAALKDQLAAGLPATARDGMSPQDQLRAVRGRVGAQLERLSDAFLRGVVPALAAAGIRLSDWEALDEDDRQYLVDVFERRIFPVLTPLAVDPGHPFPHISDLSLNLAVIVHDPIAGERRFARVKVPELLARFVVMPDGERFIPLEQVIAAHLDRLFPGMVAECHFPFRVTRNADLTLDEEEADDLLAAVEMELRRRRRGRAVRLEIDTHMTDEVRDLLLRELELSPSDVYVVEGPIDLGGLWSVYELDRPELKDEPWASTTQPRLSADDDGPTDLFAVLRESDVLVHHPYDSFATSVEAFIKRAAADPDVLAIKQTLYRTSGDSPIVKSLIRAAERGKQVAVLVEVKARFDEQANIAWAKALEDAGVHVVYGILGLKTHSKTALVMRQEADGIRRYAHIGTGNYNPKTARLYEDLGLLTADADLGADLTDLFNFLTGYSRQGRYRKLLVAPFSLRTRVLELIEAEAAKGPDGRIILKMNGLDDPATIDALYAAASAGVRIDLVIRSICCLRPGVPGLSDSIRVRSIVGRYLEHSRIFAFGSREERCYYIGSADLRARNLDRRVEVVVPVEEPALRSRLQEILDVNLKDTTLAWELGADGVWQPPAGVEEGVEPKDGGGTHRTLQVAAVQRARPWLEPEDMP